MNQVKEPINQNSTSLSNDYHDAETTTSTRASVQHETSTDINQLPLFAPPRYESIDSFFGDKLTRTGSKSVKTEQKTSSYSPQSCSNQNTMTIAQNQITLVRDDHEREIIEQVDTEQHLTILQIREFLRRRLNVNHVQLRYRNQLLSDDNDTLASVGLMPGESGEIIVQTDA